MYMAPPQSHTHTMQNGEPRQTSMQNSPRPARGRTERTTLAFSSSLPPPSLRRGASVAGGWLADHPLPSPPLLLRGAPLFTTWLLKLQRDKLALPLPLPRSRPVRVPEQTNGPADGRTDGQARNRDPRGRNRSHRRRRRTLS